MNDDCAELLFSDHMICLLCKAWVFVYTRIFKNEQFRRWEGHPLYPYHDRSDRFFEMFDLPDGLIDMSEENENIFWKSCDYWFDLCLLKNTTYNIIGGLPHSSGGLGVVSRIDGNLHDLQDQLFGVLHIVSEETFQHLKSFGFFSLYKTQEKKFAIMYGPLSLCNSGDEFIRNWPNMEDRDFKYEGEVFTVQPGVFGDQKEYRAVMMDLDRGVGLQPVSKGDQIFIKYVQAQHSKRKREEVVDLTNDA
jgi:hypothetical protein